MLRREPADVRRGKRRDPKQGIVASYERRLTGLLVVFDSLETDAAPKRLAPSFEYAYFLGDLHVNEIVCGRVAFAGTLSCSER